MKKLAKDLLVNDRFVMGLDMRSKSFNPIIWNIQRVFILEDLLRVYIEASAVFEMPVHLTLYLDDALEIV